MVYKTISPKAIIAKIYRDYKPTNSSWVNDAYEWMGEAIDCIRPFNGLADLNKCVKVVDYRGKLPCDIEFLEGITHCGHQIKRTGRITSKRHCKRINHSPYSETESYSLNPNYVCTSFKEGEIIVYYQGIETDQDGMPMIADNYEVKEAVSWYILMKMCLRGFKHPVVNFQMAEAQWKEHYPRAENSCKMPDIDGYDLFKRTYMGLVSNTQLSNTFFQDSIIVDNTQIGDLTLPFKLGNKLA